MTVSLKSLVSARLRRCRADMAGQKLDALVVADPLDVTYLTGFTGDDSILVLTKGRKILVTDSRYVLQVHRQCPRLALQVRKGAMSEAVGLALERCLGPKRRRNLKRNIGIERNSVTLAQYRLLRRALGRDLKEINPLVLPLRQRKDKYELNQIRKAVRVAEDALVDTLAWLKPGLQENEVAARLEYEMARRGSSQPAFRSAGRGSGKRRRRRGSAPQGSHPASR